MSERLGRRKMDHIEATGAQVVATGNVGCILQIARKVKERGKHIRSRASGRSARSGLPREVQWRTAMTCYRLWLRPSIAGYEMSSV